MRTCKTCGEIKPLNAENWVARDEEKSDKIYYSRHCKLCVNERSRIGASVMRKTRKLGIFKDGYTCIEEPEITGYLDSHFPRTTFEHMLDDGLLPPGTVWQNHRTGRKYKIVGNEVYFKFPDNFEDAKGQKLRWVRE